MVDMKIEMIETGKLIPYARNPRHNEDAVSKLAASIKEFGFQQPIVVDEENVVIVGHTRLKAAQALDMEKVPVHVAKGLTPQQVKAYRLADNRLHEDSSWDNALLKLELQELDEAAYDLINTAFSQIQIDEILELGEDVEEDEIWGGMPEMDQEEGTFRTIHVHFRNQEDVNDFAKMMGQTITEKTKYIWHPEKETEDLYNYVAVNE